MFRFLFVIVMLETTGTQSPNLGSVNCPTSWYWIIIEQTLVHSLLLFVRAAKIVVLYQNGSITAKLFLNNRLTEACED